jgi:uncharacterized protein YecT (DUF1311 family)
MQAGGGGVIVLPLLFLLQPQVDCNEPITQRDMNFCSHQEFEVADKALNEQWRKVAAHKKRDDEAAAKNEAEGGYFQKLLDAQRAWLAYRDNHCEAVSDVYRGGSIRPLIHNLCKAELTAQRTDQLQKMIEPN